MELTKMEISFNSNRLEKIFNDWGKLLKYVKNEKIAQSVLSKLRDIQMSSDLFEFYSVQSNCRMHPLKWKRKNTIAIDALNKTCPFRIIFITSNWENVVTDWENKEKFKTITSIKIIELSDHYK